VSFIVITGFIALVLFAFPFVTRRRFGSLGLALAAGWLLSDLWAREATDIVRAAGIDVAAPPLESIVAVVLTIVPALFVLHAGPVYHSMLFRVIGSGLFALLGVALLLPLLMSGLVIEGSGQNFYDFLSSNRTNLITIGLVAAIADVFFTKSVKTPKHAGKH